jgi:hypothetical protein
MPNRNYNRGVRAENRCVKQCLADGYHTAWRSAGSHGPADVTAVGNTHTKFMQVKSTQDDKVTFAAELRQFRAWPVPEPCQKEFWIWMAQHRKWMVIPCR